MARSLARIRSALLAAGLLLLSPAVFAQHGGGGHPGGGGGGMGMPGGHFPGASGSPGDNGPFGDRSNLPRGGPPPGNAPEAGSTTSTMRGGLQMGPPGRWWDDKHFAKDLKLRSDQQRRMDSVFEANRGNLLRNFQSLEQEQNRLESLVHAKNLDEGALFAQIDRVALARADLEKANAHYLLQIRNEMDADQIQRLEQHR